MGRGERRRRCGWLPGAVSVLLVAASSLAASGAGGDGPPPVITLDEAIHRAEANEPGYAASAAESKSASLERWNARADLLPGVTYHNQALYTQANGQQNQAGQGVGSQPSPKFIANNAVREYASQAVVNETIGLGQLAGVRRADAEAARTAAELEIARRGLVVAVTELYFGAIAADDKLQVAARAQDEAAEFTSMTGKREQAREAAHADLVKAQLVEQQRQRDLGDARVAAQKARLELAVLLFGDPRTAFTLAPAGDPPEIPARAEVDAAAGKNNPELKSAFAALGVSNADVLAARAALLPDLGLNLTYGIDAPQFAANGPDKVRNLGYSASVTVDIPVWDWLSSERKVKQSEIRRDAARVALTAAQKRLIADLDEAYLEAATAREQLVSLDTSAATAAESLRLTKLRYSEGEASVFEVVDAETSLIGAQNAREDGRVRYQIARAELETLTGTL